MAKKHPTGMEATTLVAQWEQDAQTQRIVMDDARTALNRWVAARELLDERIVELQGVRTQAADRLSKLLSDLAQLRGPKEG